MPGIGSFGGSQLPITGVFHLATDVAASCGTLTRSLHGWMHGRGALFHPVRQPATRALLNQGTFAPCTPGPSEETLASP